MTNGDELLDDDLEADRSEIRQAVVMTAVSVVVLVAASALMLIVGMPAF